VGLQVISLLALLVSFVPGNETECIMTLEGVSRIEAALGIRLPDAYKALVTNYPPELFQHAAGFDLMDDPDRVIAMNRELRISPFCGRGITLQSERTVVEISTASI
jgi:hypothetical protein